MATKLMLLFTFSSVLVHFTDAVPENGVKEMTLDTTKDQYKSFAKSLFKDATITISVRTVIDQSENGDVGNNDKKPANNKKVNKRDTKSELILQWYLLRSSCAQYFVQVKDQMLQEKSLELLSTAQAASDSSPVTMYKQGEVPLGTAGHVVKHITLEKLVPVKDEANQKNSEKNQGKGDTDQDESTKNEKKSEELLAKKKKGKDHRKKPLDNRKKGQSKGRKVKSKNKEVHSESKKGDKNELNKQGERRKRDLDPKRLVRNAKSTTAERTRAKSITAKLKSTTAKVPKTPGMDGNYLLVIHLKKGRDQKKGISVLVKVRIKMNTGYLSAADWPLLPFYGAMSLVYLAYGVVWLIVSACQWRELLRIQFWIGGVIALGMLEKAVLFSEYNNVNDSGVPAHGLVVLALVLSCIKRTLSRILIIIVSMGFGIVKPRLGGALHRVLGVGCLYFILSVIEGSYREFSVKADVNRQQVIASVPLSVLDAVICWWIFMSLLQTMRTLRIRKNLVKLSLYRHFTNILVVSVIASVAFMVWVIKAHSFNPCIKDWKEIWIDEAFWHFLFALILLAIMVLWRPTANNQRYAFTPLIDVGEDDDDDDMTLSDAFQGMKMRNKGEAEVPNRAEKNRKKAEDDLKWVEENIPTSGGIDTALPSLLDSDEEIMTTKLERNKME